MLNDIKAVYDIINAQCSLSDYHTGKDTFDCAWTIDMHYKTRFTAFIEHLCNKNIIDIYDANELMNRFQQNNFGE